MPPVPSRCSFALQTQAQLSGTLVGFVSKLRESQWLTPIFEHHPIPVFIFVRRLVSKFLTQMFEQRTFSCLALFKDWCELPLGSLVSQNRIFFTQNMHAFFFFVVLSASS